MVLSKIYPTVAVEMETITHVFRDLLVQYLDPKHIVNSLRFELGPRFSLIFDANKRSRREGMEELLQALDQMQEKRGVAMKFMDSLKRTGNTFLHDVITGKEKLDDNWELKNLLLDTEEDLMKVPPLELLPFLTCFENHEREAVRAIERNYGPQVACSELFLLLGAKHPTVIEEVITGLRAIAGFQLLAQSLEDAFKGQHREGNNNPTVEIETLTHTFRDLLVQYLDPRCVSNSLRFELGPRFSLIFDASKRSRREGTEELLQALDQMQEKRGVAKRFMDSLKRSGNKFLHDVIIGKEKLDDSWELKNLLLDTNEDLMKVPPLELLPFLTCFKNHERKAVRATERNFGPQVACSELFLRLEAKHPIVIQEVIDGLRAIGYHLVAQSLEDAYKGRQRASDPPQRHPEPEASFTPGYPSKVEEEDVQRKGEEKKVNNSEQPPLNASLPTPVQEMRQRTPVSDPQARETRSGGSAASSPSRDLQVRHDESESDECNTSPPPERRSAQMKRGASGEAEGLGNSSPAMDAGAVGVKVRQRDDGLTGRKAARGRMEDGKRKRREVGNREEEWRNIPSESEQDNRGKQNNLSPVIDSRAFNWNSGQTNNFKAPNEYNIREEEGLETGIHSLSSNDVNPKYARAFNSISLSEINEGISRENTASGSCLQQNDKGNTESTGEVQEGADRSGTGKMGAIGGVETVDASNDNQDSLIMRVGTSVLRDVRGYIPTVLNSESELILKP